MRIYRVQLVYGLHTFTRGLKPGEVIDQVLAYCDTRECRMFDFERYRLSCRLPVVVENLHTRKCFHSGKGNFFVVELLGKEGQPVEYEVYFEASKSSLHGILNLFVQSAYVRDDAHRGGRPHRKPIGFLILLNNVQMNRRTRIPK